MEENETTEEYQARLEKEGIDVVDVPEVDLKNEDDLNPDLEEEVKKEDEEEVKEEDKDKKEELPEPKEFKKRSIYDEYKDKKSELKTEKELRESAEAERDTLQAKLDGKPEETNIDELSEFAKEIDADPEAIKKLQTIFLKGFPTDTLDESLKKDLEEFKAWKESNENVLTKQAFNEEFSLILPTIKKEFPQASEEEMVNVKGEFDKLAHTEQFHNTTLDYVFFQNKSVFEALISPKKRGMETKDNQDIVDDDFEFDPNVDITKLSPKNLEKWEEQYRKATSSDKLEDDGQGGSILI